MLKLVKQLYSRWCGRRIGEILYQEDSPYIVGSLCNFLPLACQTKSERDSLRFAVLKYTWTGWDWKLVERLVVPRDELIKLLKEKEQDNEPVSKV